MKARFSYKIKIFSILITALYISVIIVYCFFCHISAKSILNIHEEKTYARYDMANRMYSKIFDDYLDGGALAEWAKDSFGKLDTEQKLGSFLEMGRKEKALLYNEWKTGVEQYLRITGVDIYSDIDFFNMYFYDRRHQILFDSNTTYYEKVGFEACDKLFNEYEEGWFLNSKIEYYYTNQNRIVSIAGKYISYVCPVFSDRDDSEAAYLCVNISVDFFGSLFADRDGENYFNVLLKDQTLLYQMEAEQKIRPLSKLLLFLETGGQEKQDISYIFANDFVIRDETPCIMILDDFNRQMEGFWWVLLILLIVCILIGFFLTRHFYKPLYILYIGLKETARGHIEYRIMDKRKDEYGDVYRKFNDMLDKINELINKIAVEEKLRAENEIRLQQEQMNPHFMYNTLETIYSLALLGENEKISEMALSLSNFYRQTLGGGMGDVSLFNALKISEYYVSIQNIRFGDIFEFSVDIPAEFMEVLVPKYSIQIFVENAILHGTVVYNRKNRIKCFAFVTEGALTIMVEDHGIGIADEKCFELKGQFARGEISDENFALCNLNRQLRLKYGKNFGVQVKCLEIGGTLAAFSVPYKREGK